MCLVKKLSSVVLRVSILLFPLALGGHVFASDSAHSSFVSESFPYGNQELETLWLTKDIKHELEDKFDFSLSQARIRYWREGGRTAWVLEEIGKEKPITMGVLVEQEQILNIAVLTYRESRGGEIKYPFFRQQFYGAHLVDKKRSLGLSENIDGITGATLSVRAMTKVAKVALYLHQQVITPTNV